jgi:hypothetical protein
MIYNFKVSSIPARNKNFKRGKLFEVTYRDGSKENKNFTIYNREDEVEAVKIITYNITEKSNPYPDAIDILDANPAFNPKALTVLSSFDLDFRTVSVAIVNDPSCQYKQIYFSKISEKVFDQELAELTSDKHSEISKKILSISIPYNSPYLLASVAKKSKGIFRRPNYPNALVCTEEVMKEFKKNKITGINFYPIEIEDKNHKR